MSKRLGRRQKRPVQKTQRPKITPTDSAEVAEAKTAPAVDAQIQRHLLMMLIQSKPQWQWSRRSRQTLTATPMNGLSEIVAVVVVVADRSVCHLKALKLPTMKMKVLSTTRTMPTRLINLPRLQTLKTPQKVHDTDLRINVAKADVGVREVLNLQHLKKIRLQMLPR
jgi:hypothetical protein